MVLLAEQFATPKVVTCYAMLIWYSSFSH